METPNRNMRVVFVEFMIGMIMVFVVMVHAGWNLNQFSTGIIGGDPSDPVASVTGSLGPLGIVAEAIYPVLFMFFIVSGYFYKPERDVRKSLVKRLKRMIPGFLTCIVVLPLATYVVMYACGTSLSLQDAASNVVLLLCGQSFVENLGFTIHMVPPAEVLGPYYFIELMIFADVVYFSIVRWATAKDSNMLAAIFAMLFIGGVLVVSRLGVFNIDKSFIAVAFMLFGTCLGRIRLFETMENRMKTARHWRIFLVALVTLVLLATFFPTGMAFNLSSIGAHGVFSAFTLFALGVTCMFVFSTLMALLYKVPGIRQLLSYIGRYPFQILLYNMFYLVLPALLIKGEVADCLFFDTIPEALPYIVFSIVMSILTAMATDAVKMRYSTPDL